MVFIFEAIFVTIQLEDKLYFKGVFSTQKRGPALIVKANEKKKFKDKD